MHKMWLYALRKGGSVISLALKHVLYILLCNKIFCIYMETAEVMFIFFIVNDGVKKSRCMFDHDSTH